ncbi:hypothetical protein [Companilactobacillus ginsenosidimutans]|uniref:hypothetical protein n=1 Tax=Companilactobacillus ginsenosidimutans TaxID=1007676 RepID=UPI0012EEDEFE|nr:hypothetical protein [Companilactobacillus ginsenosidimutans]
MRKPFFILLVMTIFLTIVGCKKQTQAAMSEIDTHKHSQIKTIDQGIDRNKLNWNKEKQAVKQVVYSSGLTTNEINNADIPIFSELGNGPNNLVMGTIVNYSKIDNSMLVPRTKMQVHVQQVLQGDKKLKNQLITTDMMGGLIKEKNYYVSVEGEVMPGRDTNDLIFVENETTPQPEIGTQVVVAVKHAYIPSKQTKNERDSLRRNGLIGPNSFQSLEPEYLMWVKDTQTNQFVNINTDLRSNLQDNNKRMKVSNLKELENKINSKIRA